MKRMILTATGVGAATLVLTALAMPTTHAQTATPTSTPDSAKLATASPLTATSATSDVIPLRLAERIAGTYGFGPGEPITPQILVGQLPPNFAQQIPLPENVTILGSVVRGESGAIVFAETSDAPDIALSLIGERLRAGGWTTPTASNMMPGGFVSAPGYGINATFCKGEDSPTINVGAEEGRSPITATAVNMTYIAYQSDGYGYSACNQPPMMGMNPTARLPVLKGPQGARQNGGGATTGGDRISSYASFVTSATVTSLLDHFGGQLKTAGWKEGEKGGNGPLAWSRWTKADDKGKPQNGLMFVLEEGGAQPSRLVYFQVSTGNARGAVTQTITQLERSAP